MKQAIEEAKARLMAGHDPDEVLQQFAAKVRGRSCPKCGEDDLCFRCKVSDTLGEKVVLSLPLLIPKVAGMIKEWHQEHQQRKQASHRRGWRPPRGQRF